MNLTIIADRRDFEHAVKAVSALDTSTLSTSLNAVKDASLLGQIDSVWDDILTALRKGYEFGSEKARDLLNQAITHAEQLLLEAGSRARDVQDALLQKLQVWVQDFISSALKRVPTAIALGDLTYNITKVTCTQKLVMTGSIKMNLTEVFALTSNGELQVAVDYEVRQ